jgi:hypothetical protein
MLKEAVIGYFYLLSRTSIESKTGLNGRCWLDETRFLGAFTKLRKYIISSVMSVCLSVRPHGIPLLTLDGFSQNVIFDHFFENLFGELKFH